MVLKIGSSCSCVFTSLSSTLRPKLSLKASTKSGSIYFLQLDAAQPGNDKVVKSCRILHEKMIMNERFQKRAYGFAISEDQEAYIELEPDAPDPESCHYPTEDVPSSNTSFSYNEAGGKPGLISFYRVPYRGENEDIAIPLEKQNTLIWFLGPAVLVASFIFPSLYLRRIISTIFEDSLLTDFLILFFTEAIFYCGVAVYLLLIDHLRRSIKPVSSQIYRSDTPLLAHRISSVAVLVLSLVIPMVTMGFVWPWTGPAASATLAPYLVGIVVQYAFEQYARYCKSPSWPVIPIVFQVYRLHQLNRAAQLVTALSLTVRGAEMTPQNLAINGSLTTLLNVLQVLGLICIWSLSSFVMRNLSSETVPKHD